LRIKSIRIENNKVLGNIFLSFTDKNDQIVDTVIFAGENGTGKSTILNIIYEFSLYNVVTGNPSEKRTFIVSLSDKDIELLNENQNNKSYFINGILDNELQIDFDFSIMGSWQQIKISYKDSSGNNKSVFGNVFNEIEIKAMFRSIFSDVEINFTPQNIKSVTAKDVDEKINGSIKSSLNLATEITQLIIDVQALDAEDFLQWARKNNNKIIDSNMIDIRMSRFKEAFNFMFPNKKYKEVRNENGSKKVVFEEYEKEVTLDKLSSGEKQIVFRGSFLLKDLKSNSGILALIDEPELSLHPNWQLKIIDFYKRLFTNEKGIQTSQIFFVTHSPFIIHNENRNNDKVIILKKDEKGDIFTPENGEYYSWTNEEVIEEAFNINVMRNNISKIKKNIVITEGKTDWKHLKTSLIKFRQEGKFIEDNFEFLEYENNIEMGDKDLISLCEQMCKIQNDYKIICVFDRDVPDTLKKIEDKKLKFKKWGNNVFSFGIPVPQHRLNTPSISIEHYYTDSELKFYDGNGRRLYLGNEFSRKSGLHMDQDKFCLKKDRCGQYSIKIIDCEVFMNTNENQNIAMSKNDFAENILNGISPFDKVGYKSFEEIFDIIREITFI
jgi:predicted ATPase